MRDLATNSLDFPQAVFNGPAIQNGDQQSDDRNERPQEASPERQVGQPSFGLVSDLSALLADNDLGSTTRPTGRVDCNRDAMAGFAEPQSRFVSYPYWCPAHG